MAQAASATGPDGDRSGRKPARPAWRTVAAAAALAAGLAGGPAQGAARAAAATGIAWQPCGPLECAGVTVPVNWDQPSGAHLRLGIAELPAARQPARGVLVADALEPDGVGGSAIAFLQSHSGALTRLLPLVHQSLDIVVIDRRGFGTSDPLTCTVPAHDPSVTDLPATAPALARLLAHDRAVARGCAGSGALLHHLDTVSSARDLDAVRRALGLARVRYLGETNGASLGATYAALYPRHVAAMVLDGVPAQQLPGLPRILSAARAGEDSFGRFAAWCHASPSCALFGQDVGAQFDAAVRAANQGRLGALTGEEIQLTTSHLVLGEHLYEWALLGQAIAAASLGDPGTFATLARTEYAEPDYTASRAAGCAGYPASPLTPALTAALSRQFPHLGGMSEWSDLAAACAGWPIPARPPRPLRVTGTPPILIVNTTHDSTTPYPWAVSMARHIAGSRLLTVDADGHLGLDNSPACAAAAEDSYLTGGTLPPPGLICRN